MNMHRDTTHDDEEDDDDDEEGDYEDSERMRLLAKSRPSVASATTTASNTSIMRPSRMRRDAVDEGPRDDSVDEDEPGWTDLMYYLCFDLNQFWLQWDRWNQLLIKEDLDRQYNKLSEYVQYEQDDLLPKEKAFSQRLDALRARMNAKLGDLKAFTRKDVEERLSVPEQLELNEIELMEQEIQRKRATLEILVTYLNNINQLRADSNSVLHDMALIKKLDDVSRVTKSTRGLDIRQYSKQMCEQLHDITQQLGTLTKTQQRLMEVDLARKDGAVESRVNRQSAVDLLFRKAVPVTATAQPQQPVAVASANRTSRMTPIKEWFSSITNLNHEMAKSKVPVKKNDAYAKHIENMNRINDKYCKITQGASNSEDERKRIREKWEEVMNSEMDRYHTSQ